MPRSSRRLWTFVAIAYTPASMRSTVGPPPNGPPGWPLPVRSQSARPRRFSARSYGSWARQRTSCVANGPQSEPGAAPVGGRDRVDHRRSDAGRRGRVDRSRQAQRGGEQVRVAGRVGEGAEAAHREAGDRALPPRVERPVVAVDPGDQLLDVPVLPARLAAGAVVEPVRVEAAAAAVGHHDDQRELGRELLGLALAGAGPGGLVAARAVEQVQHRVAVLALRGVSGREQDADLRRLRPGRRCSA